MKEKRGWRAFVCPECRCIFRLNVSEKTSGSICPSCYFLLQLPDRSEDRGGDYDLGSERANKRLNSHSRAATILHREQRDPEAKWDQTTKEGDKSSRWVVMIMALGLLGFVAIGIASFFLLKQQENRKRALVDFHQHGKHLESRQVDGENSQEVEEELKKEMTKVLTEGEILEIVAEIVPEFLAAKSIEELQKYTRLSEKEREKMEAYYWDKPLGDDELIKLDTNEKVGFDGKFMGVNLYTKKHEQRVMIFEAVGRELKIDWESWVDWSTMSWEKFQEERPVIPQEFRVNLKAASYYNYHFTDERKWRCLALESSDKQHLIYAYVERNSLLENQINVDNETEGEVTATLTLKFLPNSPSSNQVLIDKFLRRGWIGSD